MRPTPADQPDDGRYDADCPLPLPVVPPCRAGPASGHPCAIAGHSREPSQACLRRPIPRWRAAAALPFDVIVTVLSVLALGLLVVASACVFAGERIGGQPWR